MASRSLASGAMLVALLAAMGGAALQQASGGPEAGSADIEIADAETAAPETPAPETVEIEIAEAPEPVAPDEDSAATNPDADEPVLQEAPEAGVAAIDDEPSEPSVPADLPPQTAATQPRERALQPPADIGPAAGAGDDAIAIAPVPPRRPEGLVARPAEPAPAPAPAPGSGIIAEPVPTLGSSPFMSLEERRALGPLPAPVPPEEIPGPPGELVAITGPDGRVIWVYPEQVQNPSSRVIINQNLSTPTPPNPSNPFGFVYD